MITLFLIYTGAWTYSISVTVVLTILICLEWLILVFMFRRYRIKKRASWGKVIKILVFTNLLYIVVGYILLDIAVLSEDPLPWLGPWADWQAL